LVDTDVVATNPNAAIIAITATIVVFGSSSQVTILFNVEIYQINLT